MKEEIFGPFLPIKPYREAQEVIDYINDHDRPLAFYPFTNDRKLADRYITQVISGSVGINEAIVQAGAERDRLPFGGVGASGMGQYHGHEGFLTFSKLRSILRQARTRRSRWRCSRLRRTRELALDGCTNCGARVCRDALTEPWFDASRLPGRPGHRHETENATGLASGRTELLRQPAASWATEPRSRRPGSQVI